MGTKIIKKVLDYRNFLGIFGITALIVSFGYMVYAQTYGNVTYNFSGDYVDNRTQPAENSDFIVGAYVAEPTGFTDVNITNDLVVDDNLTVGNEFSAATTTATYEVSLDFDQATTTNTGELVILGSVRIDGSKVCFPDKSAIVTSGSLPFATDFNASTSTCSDVNATSCGDGTASFNTTSTTSFIKVTEQTTSTPFGYPINGGDNEGSYPLEAFTVSTGDWLLFTIDWSAYKTATSTGLTGDDAAGNTMTGTAYVNCVAQ